MAIDQLTYEMPHIYNLENKKLAWSTVKNWWLQYQKDPEVFKKAKKLGGQAYTSAVPPEVVMLAKTAIQDLVGTGTQ
jgi:hypothetical protein